MRAGLNASCAEEGRGLVHLLGSEGVQVVESAILQSLELLLQMVGVIAGVGVTACDRS